MFKIPEIGFEKESTTCMKIPRQPTGVSSSPSVPCADVTILASGEEMANSSQLAAGQEQLANHINTPTGALVSALIKKKFDLKTFRLYKIF